MFNGKQNKKKIIAVTASVGFACIIVASIALGYYLNHRPTASHTEPSEQQQEQQATQPVQLYVRESTANWSEQQWLMDVPLESVTKIHFVKQSASDGIFSWNFDGFNCKQLKDGSVYFVVGADRVKITGSMEAGFANMPNLTEIKGTELLDLSEVENISRLFENDTDLVSINMNFSECENIKKADAMFAGCENLTSIDLSQLDLKNVTSLTDMFKNCYKASVVSLPKIGAVKDISGMFQNVGIGADRQTQILGNLNTAACEKMVETFAGSNLYSYHLVENLNTQSLINAERMFFRSNFTEINLSKWQTQNLKNTRKMFAESMELMRCDLSNWSVPELEYCDRMFDLCTSLQNVNLNWTDIKHIKDMSFMFAENLALESIDLTCFDIAEQIDVSFNILAACDESIEKKGQVFAR